MKYTFKSLDGREDCIAVRVVKKGLKILVFSRTSIYHDYSIEMSHLEIMSEKRAKELIKETYDSYVLEYSPIFREESKRRKREKLIKTD